MPSPVKTFSTNQILIVKPCSSCLFGVQESYAQDLGFQKAKKLLLFCYHRLFYYYLSPRNSSKIIENFHDFLIKKYKAPKFISLE